MVKAESSEELEIDVKGEKANKKGEKKEETTTEGKCYCEQIKFKKPLIPREQKIFDYLMENRGTIVYAKDMAALLDLPRDYVYKYIKNLRQKLIEGTLCNADNGGYVLRV